MSSFCTYIRTSNIHSMYIACLYVRYVACVCMWVYVYVGVAHTYTYIHTQTHVRRTYISDIQIAFNTHIHTHILYVMASHIPT